MSQRFQFNNGIRWGLGCALAMLVAMALPNCLFAQSGSRTVRPQGAQSGSSTRAAGTAQAGSGSRVVSGSSSKAGTVALRGYCPVCVVEMKQWVKGNPQYAVNHDGKTYLFPSEKQKQMFLEHPEKYTPVLGGDCAVALVEMGKRVPGSLQYTALHRGRLYMFANQQAKEMFLANPTKYQDADLAFGGKCPVCRTTMGKDMPGNPEFTTIYNGLRFQFPSAEHQQMFNQDPQKFVRAN